MAAMDFPASPTDGQVYGNYVWSASTGAWLSKGVTQTTAVTSDVAPSNPKAGDMWYNSTDGVMYLYYNDGNTSQWVQFKNDASFSSTLGPRVDALDANANTNYIINGAFDIWQRGTSFSGNVYCADRWYGGNNPSAISRSTDVQSGFNYSLDITGANHLLGHRIEAAEASKLTGKTVTLSFYAKSLSGTNSMTAAIGTPSAIDNFAISNIEYTSSAIAITSSWARYSVTFSALSANISKGLFIYLYRNGSTSTDRTLITGVQLQAGSTLTDFHRAAPTLQGELAACQRYYYRQTATAPYSIFGYGNGMGSSSTEFGVPFPVTMRAIPTSMDSSNIGGGTPGVITLNPSSLSFQSGKSGTTIGSVSLTSTNNAASGSFVFLWANNTTSAYLGFSAEL